MPAKPLTKRLGILTIGIVVGAAAVCAMPYLGINFRLLPYTDDGYTIVPPNPRSPTNRAEQIFSQFAHQLHPPCTSKEVHRVLNATWLKREMISRIFILGGKIPVSHDSEPFVFTVYSEDGKRWGDIYIGISGGAETKEEAFAFLTGTGSDDLRMTEFALCYPPTLGHPRRIERFTWWGIQGSDW